MPLRLYLPLIIIAGLLLMREARVAPLNGIEDRFVAWLSREVAAAEHEAPAAKASLPVTLLEINDEELSFKAWPWSPFDYSLALHAALNFQPALLIIEPSLTWPEANPQQLALLHRHLLGAPRLVLGARFMEEGENTSAPAETGVPLEKTALKFNGKREELAALPEYGSIATLPEESLQMIGKIGFTNFSESLVRGRGEEANRLEKLPLVYRYRAKVYPSLTLQAAMQLFGVTPEETVVIPGEAILLGKERMIPIDSEGGMRVLFGTKFDRLSVSDLLLAAEQPAGEAAARVSKLKGGLVLLGRTDAGAAKVEVMRVERTPAEIVAHALATIQGHAFLRSAPVWSEFVLIAMLAGFALALKRTGKVAALLLGMGFGAVYCLAALGLAIGLGVGLPFVLPMGLLILVVAGRQMQ